MSYAPDTLDIFRRSATYVDRILKGEKPGDLPAQAPINSNLCSISRPRRRSASICRRRCLRLPTK